MFWFTRGWQKLLAKGTVVNCAIETTCVLSTKSWSLSFAGHVRCNLPVDLVRGDNPLPTAGSLALFGPRTCGLIALCRPHVGEIVDLVREF